MSSKSPLSFKLLGPVGNVTSIPAIQAAATLEAETTTSIASPAVISLILVNWGNVTHVKAPSSFNSIERIASLSKETLPSSNDEVKICIVLTFAIVSAPVIPPNCPANDAENSVSNCKISVKVAEADVAAVTFTVDEDTEYPYSPAP